MEDSALLEALSSMIKQQIAPLQAEIADLKKESTSNFQRVNIALQEAKAEREEIRERLSEVADTLEGGLSIVDKLEQRMNPVAEYVETMIFHANESNHT